MTSFAIKEPSGYLLAFIRKCIQEEASTPSAALVLTAVTTLTIIDSNDNNTTMSPKKHHQTANLWPTTITTSRYHSTTSKSTNYNCTLTTLVRSLTTLRNSFYTPHHFPKFLFGFMTVSGVAGYYCMEYWYEKSVGERNEIYSAAYHQHGGGGGVMKRQRTVRDGHYEGRRKLFFDGVMEWLSPYQQMMLQQQQQQQQQQGGSNSCHEEEGRLTTLANRLTTAAPNHQSMSLQRQVTKFW